MNKTVKTLLLVVLVPSLLIGALYGGLLLVRRASRKPVTVYPVEQAGMKDLYLGRSEASGVVTTDRFQREYVGSEQLVTQVYVTEGQEVKAGDPLYAFDTTLSELDLAKAKIQTQRLRLQLEALEKEYRQLLALKPYQEVLVTPEPLGIVYEPVSVPALISGSGDLTDPFYVLVEEETVLTETELSLLEQARAGILEERAQEQETPAGDSNGFFYAAFVIRQDNALNAPVLSCWGLGLRAAESGYELSCYEPVLSEEILASESEPEPYYIQTGSQYTAAELTEMRNDCRERIKSLEGELRLAGVEEQRLEQQLSDGVVRSKLDGTVKTLNDYEYALQSGEPFLEVSAGGGFYIDVAMSELELATMQLGQEVSVQSWRLDTTVTGVVESIGDFPTEDGESYSYGGNTNNVSYYPVKVFVSEEAALAEGEWVSVIYSSAADGDILFYLGGEYIRQSGTQSYCFVRGADGLLEKRLLRTGRAVENGYYYPVLEGLSEEDYVAVAYGSNVTEGAATTEEEQFVLF